MVFDNLVVVVAVVGVAAVAVVVAGSGFASDFQ